MRRSRGSGADATAHGRWTARGGALATLLLFSCATGALAQYSVRPVVLDFEAAGERSIAVRNESDEPLILRIHPGDFDQSEDGMHRFLPFGDHPSSCQESLRVFPDHLVVDPGADGVVRVRLEGRATSCWSVVHVEHRPASSPGRARAIQRVAVQVLGRGPDAVREAAIRAVAVEPDPGGAAVVYRIENDGTLALRPRGRLEVRTLDGEIVASARLDPFGLLPGHGRTRRVALPEDLPEGTLLAVPILDFGGEHLIAGRALFEHGR